MRWTSNFNISSIMVPRCLIDLRVLTKNPFIMSLGTTFLYFLLNITAFVFSVANVPAELFQLRLRSTRFLGLFPLWYHYYHLLQLWCRRQTQWGLHLTEDVHEALCCSSYSIIEPTTQPCGTPYVKFTDKISPATPEQAITANMSLNYKMNSLKM